MKNEMENGVANDARVAKWGHSLAVRIPQAIVKKARLAEGDRLSLGLARDGSIVLKSRRRSYALDALVSKISPRNRHTEADWGPPRGREAW
jgi:antitoxin MazE